MDGPSLFLHVGPHKTGTTSFQKYCLKHRAELSEQRLAFFAPRNTPNQRRVSLASAREGVFNGESLTPESAAAIGREVSHELRTFATANPGQNLLLSSESMSFLRTDAEMDRLKALLPPGYRLHGVWVERGIDSWWASYCNEIRKRGIEDHHDPRARGYLDRNGWLTDHPAVLALLQKHLDGLTVIRYSSDVVADLLRAVGVSISPTYSPLRANQRVRFVRLHRVRRYLAKT